MDRMKDQRMVVLIDTFLNELGHDRNIVPMDEVTDFALDLRNIVTEVN